MVAILSTSVIPRRPSTISIISRMGRKETGGFGSILVNSGHLAPEIRNEFGTPQTLAVRDRVDYLDDQPHDLAGNAESGA